MNKKTSNNVPKTQCAILEGMKIIASYYSSEEPIEVAAEHDMIFYGDFKKKINEMTEEDVCRLRDLGWFTTTYEDCWVHFV